MARYTPAFVPDPVMNMELAKIAQAIETPDEQFNLKMLYAEPSKKRDGMIVLADGTSWQPTGVAVQGFYGYYGGAWHFLG